MLAETDLQQAHTASCQSGDRSMDAVTFSGCFGWYHYSAGKIGAIICPGFGRDDLLSYRSMYHLATQLASTGFPVLRLHYRGTGNSAAVESENKIDEWRSSITDAVRWLKNHCQVDKIILIGFRFGATLVALETLNLIDVAGQVLICPCVSGRSYLRELRIISKLEAIERCSNQSCGLETRDISLSPEDMRIVDDIDLRNLQTSNLEVLLLCSDNIEHHKFFEHLKSVGGNVEVHHFAQYARMLGEFDTEIVPYEDLGAIVEWLRVNYANSRSSDASTVSATAYMSGTSWVEYPVCFGHGLKLRGLVSQCLDSDQKKAAIILNTAKEPHYGGGRFNVELARALAERGIGALRFDFTGIGDSSPRNRFDISETYGTCRVSELMEAFDFVKAMGFTQIFVVGLCSGAFHALQASIADDRIRGVVLINMLLLKWKPGTKLHALVCERVGSADDYILRSISLSLWIRLLKGGVNVNLLRRRLIDVGRIVSGRLSRMAESLCASITGSRRALGDFNVLSSRGQKVLLLLGDLDHSPSDLKRKFGPRYERLVGTRGLEVAVIEGGDHSLSRQRSRSVAYQYICNFIAFSECDRHPLDQ